MNLNNKKIAIYGLGHIGLPTAAILASNDLEVIGADVNPTTVNNINEGICSFKEPGLDELVKRVVNKWHDDFCQEIFRRSRQACRYTHCNCTHTH